MWPFRRKPEPDALANVPDTHKRVAIWADKCNEKITRLEEARADVIDRINSGREELRQIDAVLAAYRAGLTVIVDDPTLQFISNTQARNHIEEGQFAGIERELELSTVDLLK